MLLSEALRECPEKALPPLTSSWSSVCFFVARYFGLEFLTPAEGHDLPEALLVKMSEIRRFPT
jgi:hypothetical protein